MKLKRRYWLVAAVLLGTASSVQAADLLGIYREALQSNPQFQASQSQYFAAQEATPQAKGRLLPSVSGNADYSRNRQNITASSFGSTGTREFNTKDWSVVLRQTIYNKAAYAQVDQAQAQVAQAKADFLFSHQQLILSVADAYFNVLAAQDSLRFARAEKKAISQQLEQTKQRFQVGLTAITDVHEAQARYDQAVAQEIAAENQLDVTREQLREITGQSYPKLSELEKDLPLVRPAPSDVTKWVDTALDQNLQLIAARHAADAAQAQVDVARAQRYPTIDLQASHGYTDTGGLLSRESTEDSVGVQLQMPFYQGGILSSQIRQSGYQYNRARELLDQQSRSTERQARSAYLNVIADISAVKALEQALSSARTALEATQAGFEVGTRTAVEVLNSQQAVFGAERDLARSRYDYILDTLRLKEAAGTLDEQDVVLVNRWLK